jgi:hypothetical protein
MKILFLLTTAILVSACASEPVRYEYKEWRKDGVSAQARNDQLGYCRHDVQANDLSAEKADRLVAYCMKSNGYEQATVVGYR